ncbi:MAG: DUF349 domain-containing protein [Lentisphaeria bacterium]|nr:DUF349 domain-containing protein [Lentisphaeria bacterium]
MNETNTTESSGHTESTIPEALKEKLHLCEAVCRELEVLADSPGADTAAEAAALRARFDGVSGLPPEFEELLRKRFDAAMKHLELSKEENARRDALFAALRKDMESLVAAGELATLRELEQLEKKCRRFASENPGAAQAVEAEFARLAPLRERLLAEAEHEKKTVEQADALTAKLAALTAAEDITPLHDGKARIEEAYARLGKVPAEAAKRYGEAHRQASVRLARHYETLDLARWESYTLKLDLCKKLEELSALPGSEMMSVSKQLHEIRDKWKALGSVPREKSEEINPRYLELTRALQHKVDEFFSCRRQEQKQAAAEKKKLCDRAAELAGSTDWAASAEEFKEMQKQWKLLPGAGPAEHELFANFRASADAFFKARSVVLEERNRKFGEAASAKEALIAAAEQLAPGDVRGAKKLREEFMNTAFAGRGEHELRRRFDAAMNAFFSAVRDDASRKETMVRELAAELETLAADPLAGQARAREIREEFRLLSCRATAALERAALDKFGRAFEAARARAKESLCESFRPLALRVAACAGDAGAELPAETELENYPKLRQAARCIAALRAGEAGAQERLDKCFSSSRNEYEKIVSELEALGAEEAKPLTLAEELEAAILGNFAAAPAAARKKDPASEIRRLREACPGAGVLPLAELEGFFRRFDAALAAAAAKHNTVNQ